MKVYLSVDMEGIAGISHPNPTNRGDGGYPVAVELMTAEANAAQWLYVHGKLRRSELRDEPSQK